MIPLRRLPPAVRFMLGHGAVGFAAAAGFVGLLLATDPGGLATLLRGSELGPLPTLLLWFFCGLTFGSVQIGVAVMREADGDPPPPRGRRHLAAPALLRVPARPRRR